MSPLIGLPSARISFTRNDLDADDQSDCCRQKATCIGSSTADLAENRRLGLISILVLSAWCGLIAGLLEVGTIVLRKHAVDPDRLYKMSRQFVWLIPVSNVCVFLTLGLLGCGIALVWPRRGRWLVTRLLCDTVLTLRSCCFSPDLWSGLAGCDAGRGRAARSNHRTPRSGFPAIGPARLPGGRRDRGDPGGIALVGRPIPANRVRVPGPCRRRVRRTFS